MPFCFFYPKQIQLVRAHFLHERKIGAVEPVFDLRLIYAAKDEPEILFRDVLAKHASKHPNLRLYYSLMQPPPEWDQGVGFVTADMITSNFNGLSPDDEDSFIVICGPPPFCKVRSGARPPPMTRC